jgi:hypothetical protein
MPAPGTQDPIVPEDFYPPRNGGVWVPAPIKSGRFLYWWVGNPPEKDFEGTLVPKTVGALTRNFAPTGSGYVLYADSDGDGTVRDEYMRRIGEKNADEIVICTDWSGQIGAGNRGWTFIHGKQGTIAFDAPQDEAKRLLRSRKNNLYGDGHAESKRPDECTWRWGPGGPACW